MKDKVILTDCDGVLLDWEFSFHEWMKSHGYTLNTDADHEYEVALMYNILPEEKKRLVKLFNESAAIGHLTPLRDAVKYVKKLYEEHGYVFRVITSLSLDPYAGQLREENLRAVFGNAIEKVICLDTGADKDEALDKYRGTGCYWIEDKPENANCGYARRLKSLLIAHNHNADYNGPATRVQTWKEIYELIVG
jgi:hypothetical protein